jgi:hypothetical protein
MKYPTFAEMTYKDTKIEIGDSDNGLYLLIDGIDYTNAWHNTDCEPNSVDNAFHFAKATIDWAASH